MISEANDKKIAALGELFLAKHADRFAVVKGRWWHLRDDNRWYQDGARQQAGLRIHAIATQMPSTEQFAWIKRQAFRQYGINLVLAYVSNILFVEGLMGPTPPPSAPPTP